MVDTGRKGAYEEEREGERVPRKPSRGKETVDARVEKALLKKCLGYTVNLKKTYKLKRVEYDGNTGKKLREYEELAEGVSQAHVPADTNAQKFWLVNRGKDAWQATPAPAAGEAAARKADELLGGVDSAL